MSVLALAVTRFPIELRATLRERFGVSWHAAGQPSLPWPEAIALVMAAANDTSTRLGAAMASWRYPASELDLLMLRTQLSDENWPQAMPFKHENASPGELVSQEEAEEALAQLEASFTFA